MDGRTGTSLGGSHPLRGRGAPPPGGTAGAGDDRVPRRDRAAPGTDARALAPGHPGVGPASGRLPIRPCHGRGDPARSSAGAVAPDGESDPGARAPRGPPARPVVGRLARGAISRLLATPSPARG